MTEEEEGGWEARWRGGRRARPSDAQGGVCGAQEAQGGGGGEGERGRGRREEEEEETGVGEGGEWLEGRGGLGHAKDGGRAEKTMGRARVGGVVEGAGARGMEQGR